jgi:hypothetical protein
VDDAALTRFLDDVFDFACERRLDEVIDVDAVIAAVDLALTRERVDRFGARFVLPAIRRAIDRAAESDLPLARLLPQPVIDTLKGWLGRPVHVPKWVIDEIVTSEAVRDEVREMLEEAVAQAIKDGLAGGGLAAGMLGLGAKAAGAAASRIFGSAELQRGVEGRMRDMLGRGVALAQRRIAKRLASRDTAKALGKRRKRLFLRLLERPEREVARVADGVPWQDVLSLAGPIVAHNLAREEVRAALRVEIHVVLRELSTQTIGRLLDDHGLREWARGLVRARGAPLVREFVAWQLARTPGEGS